MNDKDRIIRLFIANQLVLQNHILTDILDKLIPKGLSTTYDDMEIVRNFKTTINEYQKMINNMLESEMDTGGNK